MSKAEIKRIVDSMDPGEAAKEIADVVKELLSILSEESRQEFLVDLIGDERADEESGLVHF
jgi:hypothetical protein